MVDEGPTHETRQIRTILIRIPGLSPHRRGLCCAMTFKSLLATAAFTVVLANQAHAGDKPLYAPAPAWIAAAPPLDPARLDASAPVILVFDNQQRLQDGRVWSYLDTATRIATPELLTQLGTIALPWMPDKGDLIVHSVEILRGAERIDLLAGSSEKFAVLRREQQLERRTMDGMLTATLAAAGLRLGDVLRVRMSITNADAALKGEMQAFAPLPTEPFRIIFGRSRMSWPVASPVQWRSYADGLTVTPKEEGGYRVIDLPLPLAKQPDLPNDIPGRFRKPTILDATSFADWQAVSRTMAPHYATDGAIAKGSPLAGEVAKIVAADSDPMKRAAAALLLVQDQIGYLALGMNGGNYLPQSPAKTWELRYGDCKAKTLMLLAMLREMGITAEPVLASVETGDLVNVRLPMPGAFDHVIVRADIDGRSYWLDGTGNGTRLADIGDTPPFGAVLPLRAEGAGLMPLPTRANARPDVAVTTRFDQTAGVELPSLFTTEIRVRGPIAAMLNMAATQADAKQKREMIASAVQEYVGVGQLIDTGLRFDPVTATTTITASGILTTDWRLDRKRRRIGLDKAVAQIGFDPDRSRPAWRGLPVSTGRPASSHYVTTIVLPDGGRGFLLEGDAMLTATIAGVAITRKASLDGTTVQVEERSDGSGIEIAPDAIAGERARLAQARTRMLRAVAPADLAPRWQQVLAGKGRYAALEAAYRKAIPLRLADDPTDFTGYESLQSFHRGLFDYRAAIEDATKLLVIAENADRLVARSGLYDAIGDDAKALADAKAAYALDPGSDRVVLWLAEREATAGDVKGALARIQTRIDQGGDGVDTAVSAKVTVLAGSGDVTAAMRTIDEAIAERPGNPYLLNERCWLKGTRKVSLDTALKDCTRAIELADSSANALDSRAMVYWQMGRAEEALADLDAALDQSPNVAGSLFLRGVIRRKTGRVAEGDLDLKGARLIAPTIDKTYARYGIIA